MGSPIANCASALALLRTQPITRRAILLKSVLPPAPAATTLIALA
jgi:hypothetical protein